MAFDTRTFSGATIGYIAERGMLATAFCGYSGCERFWHLVGKPLDLARCPAGETVERVQSLLRCESCDRREGVIVVSPKPLPRFVSWEELAAMAGVPIPRVRPAHHPLVKATIAAFPGSRIDAVVDRPVEPSPEAEVPV